MQQISTWRALHGSVGERELADGVPAEFWDLLDEVERLRLALEWISISGPDEAWDLREVARNALDSA